MAPSFGGFDPFSEPARPFPRLVPAPVAAPKAARRARALATGLGTLAALLALWFGAGALRGTGGARLQVVPGSVRTAHGYRYVVRPGDTLWSIATELDPTGDPRPLVAALDVQLRGGPLFVGEQLLLP